MSSIDYKAAGVDISAGNEAVKRIKPLVQKTFSPSVCSSIGAFGALYDIKDLLKDYDHPLLVQSIDGVGTKTHIASMMNRYDSIGMDLVSATANDILVMGARPLTMLDYIASDRIHPDIIESIVSGMAKACCDNNISLIGGETAEMPGTYQAGEHDLVGIVTGVVDKSKLINGDHIKPGDVVLGVHSSGLHTNGYSLARKLFFEHAGLNVDSHMDELKHSVGESLLSPHLNYCRPILHCLDANIPIKGMAHITGGGFIENIPRILPAGCSVAIQKNTWSIPPLFSIMQRLGKLSEYEMYRTFNMGIGLIIILDESAASRLIQALKGFPEYAVQAIGEVFESEQSDVRLL